APAPPSIPAPDESVGGRLLGGDEATATAGAELPEAMAEAMPEAMPEARQERWINARLEDHPQGESLKIAQVYTLAFGIDAQALEDLGPGSSVPSQVVVPQDQAELTLTVQLNSDDFSINDAARPLRVFASGLSSGRARFDITPLHDGPGTLVATFHKDGNFVQQMTLVLQVGDATAPSPQATRAGRPLLASRNLRKRDVGISVVPAAVGGFDCTVWGATQARAHLPIQEAELADAIEQLRKALMTVVMRKSASKSFPFQDAIDIAPEHRDAALVELARAGYLLYRMLFHHPAADLQCKAIGDWLRKQALDASTMLTLQVIGEGFPVPWALLYMADGWDESTVTWEGFLGLRHVIEQIPLQNDMSTADSLIEEQPAGLSVSLNLNTGIDAQMKMDVVQRQASYWTALKTTRPGLRVTTRTQASELLSALASSETDDQILYLFCHATTVGLGGVGGPNGSSLTLSNDKAVTLADLNLMAATDRKLKGNPLVFINACESGELSPMFYNGFVPYFMSKGARGVIGTECKMPALFAAEWARLFFDELLAGKPLGQTFLDLRRRFVIDHGNPLGLLYGLHSNADVQLVGGATPADP
ncbi:MAG: CHAT domain-containing protein, partial [Pseudoxanthomonas sp.]